MIIYKGLATQLWLKGKGWKNNVNNNTTSQQWHKEEEDKPTGFVSRWVKCKRNNLK
jgi:hypothetical protein